MKTRRVPPARQPLINKIRIIPIDRTQTTPILVYQIKTNLIIRFYNKQCNFTTSNHQQSLSNHCNHYLDKVHL